MAEAAAENASPALLTAAVSASISATDARRTIIIIVDIVSDSALALRDAERVIAEEAHRACELSDPVRFTSDEEAGDACLAAQAVACPGAHAEEQSNACTSLLAARLVTASDVCDEEGASGSAASSMLEDVPEASDASDASDAVSPASGLSVLGTTGDVARGVCTSRARLADADVRLATAKCAGTAKS